MTIDPLHEVNRILGKLLAQVDNIQADQAEDRQTNSAFRREVRDEIAEIKEMGTRTELAVAPIAAKIEDQGKTLEDHSSKLASFKIFQDKIVAVISLATLAVSALGAGIWYLISTYWSELLAFLGRLWPK